MRNPKAIFEGSRGLRLTTALRGAGEWQRRLPASPAAENFKIDVAFIVQGDYGR